MRNKEPRQTGTVDALGTVMILTWFLILGPIGVLLLGGTAYFIGAENVAVALLCAGPCLVPLVLTLVWGSMKLVEVLRERRVEEEPYLLPYDAVKPSP